MQYLVFYEFNGPALAQSRSLAGTHSRGFASPCSLPMFSRDASLPNKVGPYKIALRTNLRGAIDGLGHAASQRGRTAQRRSIVGGCLGTTTSRPRTMHACSLVLPPKTQSVDLPRRDAHAPAWRRARWRGAWVTLHPDLRPLRSGSFVRAGVGAAEGAWPARDNAPDRDLGEYIADRAPGWAHHRGCSYSRSPQIDLATSSRLSFSLLVTCSSCRNHGQDLFAPDAPGDRRHGGCWPGHRLRPQQGTARHSRCFHYRVPRWPCTYCRNWDRQRLV